MAALHASGVWATAQDLASAPTTKPAAPPGFSGRIETQRLEDDLYVLLGGGGNTTVHFDADRLLVIDSGVPDRGPELVAIATRLAPSASRKTLFNTHWHFDHAGGNASFAAGGFNIVGSAACRERLGQTIRVEDVNLTSQPAPEPSRPNVTFEQSLTLFEPTPVQLTKIPAAHTDTDAVAFFDAYNTLVTGDILFAGVFPFFDRSTGGSLNGMIDATRTLLGYGDGKTRVVPGHGAVGDKSALRGQLELLQLTHERLSPFGEKKATLDEVLAAKPLADLDDKWGRGFVRSPLFTRLAYGQWLDR